MADSFFFDGFSLPTYTQTPNEIFDVLLPLVRRETDPKEIMRALCENIKSFNLADVVLRRKPTSLEVG